MKGFFHPASVAIIGVSPREGNLGRNILGNLEDNQFAGDIYCVSPRGGQINGRTIYRQVSDLPRAPELAVILTPAATVPRLMQELGEKGTRRVIIESAGFSELDQSRAQLEAGILEAAEKYGMRFIGPNCLGVICNPSGLSLPFARLGVKIPQGGLSIISQSGGMGITYLTRAVEAGMGLANFVSVGNKLNLDEAELLAYMLEDPHTEVILMYLESIVAGREIFDLIRRSPKPVVVHKSNIGSTSHHIAQSHTAALANDDAVVEAALAQAGAIRGHTLAQCLEIIKGLSLPRARGRRLALISRSGGHAVAAADAAHRRGMELARFPDSFLQAVQKHTRASVIRLQNPLDLGDLFDFQVYVDILEGALALDEVDGVLFVHGYRGPETEPSHHFLRRAGELCRRYQKPVALVLMTGTPEILQAQALTSIPLFSAPDEAMLALEASARAGRGMTGERITCVQTLDQARAERILGAADARGNLELPEALHLLLAAGIPVASFGVAASPDEAVTVARSLGWPVVLKAVGADLSHKTESGGVVLGLEDEDELRRTAGDMQQRLGCSRLVVMGQVSGGSEIIVGAKQDPAFGPLVLMGLGGVTAEVIRDYSIRLAPLDDVEAGGMLDGLKGAALLKGFRGAPPADRAAILQIIMQVSQLISRLPALQELDINPVLVGPGGAVAVDARARVAPAKLH